MENILKSEISSSPLVIKNIISDFVHQLIHSERLANCLEEIKNRKPKSKYFFNRYQYGNEYQNEFVCIYDIKLFHENGIIIKQIIISDMNNLFRDNIYITSQIRDQTAMDLRIQYDESIIQFFIRNN